MMVLTPLAPNICASVAVDVMTSSVPSKRTNFRGCPRTVSVVYVGRAAPAAVSVRPFPDASVQDPTGARLPSVRPTERHHADGDNVSGNAVVGNCSATATVATTPTTLTRHHDRVAERADEAIHVLRVQPRDEPLPLGDPPTPPPA